MANYWRITIGLRKSGFTTTESYIGNSAELAEIGPRITQLLGLRAAMLKSTVEFAGVTVGQLPDPGPFLARSRRANTYLPGDYTIATHGILLSVPAHGTLQVDADKSLPDQARACIVVRARFDTNRFSNRYLAFCPDNCIANGGEGVVLANSAPFEAAYNSFVSELVSGRWLLQARFSATAIPPVQIRDWVRSGAAGTVIGIQTLNTEPLGVSVGSRIQIQASRRRGDVSYSYNGTYTVQTVIPPGSENRYTYYLQGTEGGDPATIKKNGTARRIEYNYYPFQQFSPLRAGVHKRGNSFGRPHGRRRTRVSLDP